MSVTKAGSAQAPGGQGCQQRGCGKPGKSRQRRKLGLFAPRGSEPQWRASAGGGGGSARRRAEGEGDGEQGWASGTRLGQDLEGQGARLVSA